MKALIQFVIATGPKKIGSQMVANEHFGRHQMLLVPCENLWLSKHPERLLLGAKHGRESLGYRKRSYENSECERYDGFYLALRRLD